MVITAPTPMMMPSIVSTERSKLARIDWRATATVSPSSIAKVSHPPKAAPFAAASLGRPRRR
jgi:hypothetical protein